jgi:hypothetical protein
VKSPGIKASRSLLERVTGTEHVPTRFEKKNAQKPRFKNMQDAKLFRDPKKVLMYPKQRVIL